MSTDDHDLDELLDAPAAAELRPPALIPSGWRVFLGVLLGVDLLCLILGRVPWSGAPRAMGRGDALVSILVGIALGAILGLLLSWLAARQVAGLGVTEEEAALVEDEFALIASPQRQAAVAARLGLLLLLIVCCLFVWIVLLKARFAVAVGFVYLNGLAGLALPLLWRRFHRVNPLFRAWLDERNAPFDRAAAERTVAHRARVAEIRARLAAAEQAHRERLEGVPRVPPPWYVSPSLVWAPTVLALLLDLLFLFSRGLAHMGPWRVIGGMIGHWFWGAVLIGMIWGILSWNYIEIGDQVSRRWSARDLSAGLSAIALELALAVIAVVLLTGLFGGWALRFAAWNLIAPSFFLTFLLRDIRRTAREHYARSTTQQVAPTATAAEDEEDV